MFKRFKTHLRNNISYIALHAYGIYYSYYTYGSLVLVDGKRSRIKHDGLHTILIPDLDGNYEEVIEKWRLSK